MFPATLLVRWMRKCASGLLYALTFIVFLFLDFLDAVLCVIYRYLDQVFEGKASPCYCVNRGEGDRGLGVESEVSGTLYGRRNVLREMGFFGFARKWECAGGGLVNRWTDCGCESCVSWMKNGDQKLHVVVKEHPEDSGAEPPENVIFLHGFLSSSSFWTETVFRNLSEPAKHKKYRFLAVDLLGFGKSPKPRNSMYTLKEHVEMIEQSVIHPFKLNSFHLVAHSMGCIIAVALAAKYSKSVKSVTLVAPPYIPCSNDGTSSEVLQKFAGKRLWPLMAFGSSVMSWYEHVGRCVCFLICRNHRTWERILKLLTWKRDLNFLIVDLTRHTHHSAWHSMHNVVCGGVKFMDDFLETLRKSGVRLCVIHGDQDQIVPLDCCNDLKTSFPDVELNIIRNADHRTVILGREKDFTESLGHIWAASSTAAAARIKQCCAKDCQTLKLHPPCLISSFTGTS
ncbi:hypothetical protein SLE2022_055880 [Rubroshorea leprosula]